MPGSGVRRTGTKNVRVPGHDIKITLPELLFVNTIAFQRLNHIKQLGLAYFVYPFALHTRASHCLDCLHAAQEFINHLLINVENSTLLSEGKRGEILTQLKRDVETIRAGALLHDIMHIPYAHTLEDENGILVKGDKSQRINVMLDRLGSELDELVPEQLSHDHLANYRIFSFPDIVQFGAALRKAKTLLHDVRKILWTIALHDTVEEKIRALKAKDVPKGRMYNEAKRLVEEENKGNGAKLLEADQYYIADLIGNTVSADLISYVLRDPEFTGIDTKPGGWYRVFDYLEIAEDDSGRSRMVIKLTKDGEWRQDVFSAIIRILNARYDLTEQVTFHHAKLSASAMLGKIAYLCKLSETEDLYEIGDEGLFVLFERRIKEIRKGKVDDRTGEDADGAERLLRLLRQRRLHKRFHVVTQKRFQEIDLSRKYSVPQSRFDLEKKIEKTYGLKPGSIVLFCPTGTVTLKEAAALVAYERRKTDGEFESVISPLNSEECMEFLEVEKDESTAMRVRNVEEQYKGLWKLYVFADPSVIAIFGHEIKQLLNYELGTSSSFDQSNLDLMDEYKLSKEISEKVTESRVPELDRAEVFRKIPLAIKETSGRGEHFGVASIRAKLDTVVRSAYERVGPRKDEKQAKLAP